MSQNNNIPLPVQIAQRVLETLDASQRADLSKKLPAYAMQLAKSGADITEDILRDHLQRGLPDNKPAPKTALTYEAVATPLRQDSAPIHNKNGLDYLGLSFLIPPDRTLEDMNNIIQTGGYKAYLQYFIEDLQLDITGKLPYLVQVLMRKEADDALQYLSQQGIDWSHIPLPISLDSSEDFALFLLKENKTADSETLFKFSIEKGQIGTAKTLLRQYGDDLQETDCTSAAERALESGFYDMVYFLTEQNLLTLDSLSAKKGKAVENYAAQTEKISRWYKMHGEIPAGCLNKMPELYKAQPWKTVYKALQSENVASLASLQERSSIRGGKAYQASSLFRSDEAVLQYLNKWGKPGKMPLHDLIYMIDLPAPTPTEPYDLKAWGDAVMQCGPEMAKLVKFAGKLADYRALTEEYIPGRPKRTPDGRRYSLRETQNAVAQVVYDRADENPKLAAMCIHQWLSNDAFNTILDLVRTHENKQSRLPEMSIAGEEFGMAGYNFRKLDDGDVRGLFLGNMTDCCQYIGSAGEDCAKHGFSSDNGGFYVVENAKGQIIGQTWAWRGAKDELVFDSLEYLGNRITAQNWTDICTAISEQLEENKTDITSFHIGTGGKTPSLPFPEAAKAASPVDYDGYRDSHQQYQAWKKRKLTP